MDFLNLIYFGSALHHKWFKKIQFNSGLSNYYHTHLILPRSDDSYEFLGLLLINGINITNDVVFVDPRKPIPSPIGFNQGRAFTTIPDHELVFHEVAGNKMLMEWCP